MKSTFYHVLSPDVKTYFARMKAMFPVFCKFWCKLFLQQCNSCIIVVAAKCSLKHFQKIFVCFLTSRVIFFCQIFYLLNNIFLLICVWCVNFVTAFYAPFLCPMYTKEQTDCILWSVQWSGPRARRPSHAAGSAPALMAKRAWARDCTAPPHAASPLPSRSSCSNSALRHGRRKP